MKTLCLALFSLALSSLCAGGLTDGYCSPVTETDYWTYYVTLPPYTTTITVIPPCPPIPPSTVTSTVTVNSGGPPVISTITLFSGGGSTIIQTDIIVSGGSFATTYTTTISGVQTVVSTYISEIHDFNGSVVTIESTTTAPGNNVSTGGIVGIGIGLFIFGGLLAACLLPFCIRRRPKKQEGYAPPPAQGGYGTGYGAT